MTVRCHETLSGNTPAYFYRLTRNEEKRQMKHGRHKLTNHQPAIDDNSNIVLTVSNAITCELNPNNESQHFIKLKTLILMISLIVLSNRFIESPILFANAASPPSNSITSPSLLASSASILSLDITAQFVLPNNSYFQHLTYDRRRNVLYAGAMNRILQLNRNLTVLSQATTGPKPDSPQCHAGGCTDDMETTETNNYNKVLMLDDAGDTLIACGSIHQGACEIYNNLNLFPESYKYLDIPLAANDENSSTFAFIGPSRYAAWKKEDILYVGTTFTNVGDYRHDVPAISSRKLDDLNYAEFSIQQSNINIDVKYRDHFLVDYIYGFNSSDFAYFVIVQKKSHLAEEAGFQTRLARICVNDPNYDSYTEITIQCLSHSVDGTGNGAEHFYNDRTNEYHYPQQQQPPQSGAGGGFLPGYQDFNVMRDAKITRAGQRLSQSMGIKKDDPVLVAIFSPSKEITSEPQNTSAMCVYSLKEIEEVFTENIHMCFNGSIKDRNLGYISGTIMDGKCPAVGSYGNIYNFCSVGLKISGVAPIVAHSLFTFENESVTSVTTATTGPHTLAFLGTSEGAIKKVMISGPLPGEYEKIDVDPGNQILPDTQLSPKQDYLYVLSRKKITKLRVEHCAIYTNCSSCLESRDPFCGWCSLEKRCTVRSACQRDTSASRWLSLGTGQQCIDFEMVLPDKIPINEMASVQLIIRTLPELPFNSKYKCVFGNSTPIDANVTENGLVCQTPSVKQRPQIEGNNDHVSVLVSVRSSETNKDFVSRNFAFFDCSRHDTCRQCVKTQWGCNWCIYDNKCVHNTSTCRNTGSVISSENLCPHFKHNSQPILLPNKIPKEIKLEIENLPRPQSAHTGFLCTVNIEGAHMVLPARVEANRYIICEKTPYSYEANTNEFEAKVDVNWNRNHYIDTVSIILYKCDVLGSHREHADCSLCVTRDPKYQCSWCNNQCVYNETCVYGHVNECPKPRIDMIKPLSGPIEGGTLITIEGSNLGIREEDVRGKIRIGDVPCELVNYEISVKIECRTGGISYELTAPVKVGNEAGYTESSVQFQYKDIKLQGLSPSMGPQSGGTQVSIIGKYLNIGSNIIAYLDDYVCLINVTQASSSRLTCITSAAKSPERIKTLTLVIDGANRTLQCIENNNNFNRYNSQQQQQYHHHKYNQNYNNNYYDNDSDQCSIYNYTVDPKIMQIKPLKSFISGGRMITVHGSNLDSIQKPEIEVYLDDERINKSTCYVLHSTQMECPSPSVIGKFQSYFSKADASRDGGSGGGNSHNDQRRQQQLRHKRFANANPNPQFDSFTTISSYSYSTIGSGNGNDVAALKIHETALNFQISFVMDNVQSVRDLNKHFQSLRSNIIYMEDPDFFPFSNNMKLYKGDTLVIEGNNLNIASDESDVNVTIGMMQCNVTSLALTQLVCTPPEHQPSATDENGVQQHSDLPLVVVRVGRTLRFSIGHLKYDLMKPYTLSHAMAGIICGTTVIVILLCIILIIYRRKSTQAEREYKRIQIQMDTLESNVRLECKQAFAELQTDMTDLTADLENSGIPNLDHVHYIMKVFFPGVSDHPILNSPKLRINSPRTNYDTAMIQFEQLINNKNFILVFIETLEAQKTFNIRDKVNVASLLMIVLMNKMEYATDILKCLLHRLIDKSVLTKHPQLMLRRTESVVEKMLTNYMALCMYDYLKEYSGTSLFLLFKAIKHQIEKGLVDAITNDARYSLSEERLLREQIEHSVVTLHIVQEDLDEKIQCKVLDCDTITQVKLKILDALFKNTPFSMRPSVYDVDLEWRHGRGGHLTLQDEDLTTKTIQGWRRLNTLAHYGVKESAVMSLIAKQSSESYQMQYNSKSSSYPNCYYINNPQSHLIINGDLDTSGLHHHHHHMMHQPNAPHLISPHQQMAPPLPPPITHPPPSTLPNNYHNHHSHHHHMQPQQHHHHPQSHQYRIYHLVKPQPDDFCVNSSMKPSAQTSHNHNHQQACNERTHKAIPEIFLTRLLATKGTLQKFVDDFFATILTVNDELPPAVKWLFDLLDDEARRHGINDPEVVHAWKSNSLPLRFWVNFIKNPDFIFDVNKTTTVDGCLSVIAQTFMDSCSTTDHRLGKDSPSNKLLFAKDIPQYRNMVAQFYIDIAHLPQISEQEMCTQMQQLSIQNHDEFDTIAALKELYIYVTNYRDQLLDALDSDPNCKKMHLAHKLENVACTLEGENT